MYRVREVVDYCKKKRIKPNQLTDEELGQFEIKRPEWREQFSDLEFDGYKAAQKPDTLVYALKADGYDRVQGLISMGKEESGKICFVDVKKSVPPE